MNEVVYLGEKLAFGNIGNLLLAISFASSLIAAISYFFSFSSNELNKSWLNFSRISFALHAFSVIGIFTLLCYLILDHRFEYYYVWQHSSTTLPLQYIFSCFWEGQEGSFLLWTFWHILLSIFVIRYSGKWEAPVMVTVCLVQVFLASMVLGLNLGDLKIGSNPFILLRDHPDMAGLPFINMPDYLSRINDGRGLNPLLQNYWMVIHPPTLFLGFAASLFPFAFAMAGLMTGNQKEWVTPALPWAYFAILTLGTGILMGAAWAYEALSFGGFWAWDPVENASLVPWLMLVGAAHVMLINKRNKSALLSSIILVTLTFILILYSTFLTRSGILGDTSVHAFTDLGMSGQLLLYMAFFALQALYLIIKNRKALYSSSKEDSLYSREFWMFIGMLILVISSIQITFSTSIPVWNKIFGTTMAPPENVIDHYNSWQVPIAIIICLLIAGSQFFKYKNTDPKEVNRKVALSLILSLAISITVSLLVGFPRFHYDLLFFSSVFAVIANIDYLVRILKGKLSFAGGSVAHIGIGLILLGTLLSNAKSEVISQNVLDIDLGKDFPNNENIMLIKHDTLQMGSYFVTYKGSHKDGIYIKYEIEYLEADFSSGSFQSAFTLFPMVQLNERMGNVSEPATRHFWDKDIYTHVTYADLEDANKPESENDQYDEPTNHIIGIGDTTTTSNSLVILEGLTQPNDSLQFGLNKNDVAVTAIIKVIDVNKKQYYTRPVFLIKDNTAFSKDSKIEELGLKFRFQKIDPENGKMEFDISEKKDNKRDFIIMKAIIFPQINILWIGCILMIAGTLIAIRKHIQQSRS